MYVDNSGPEPRILQEVEEQTYTMDPGASHVQQVKQEGQVCIGGAVSVRCGRSAL